MKKKNQITKLSLKKKTITSLSGSEAQKVLGGGITSYAPDVCDSQCTGNPDPDSSGKKCPFQTRFIDCLTEIPDRC